MYEGYTIKDFVIVRLVLPFVAYCQFSGCPLLCSLPGDSDGSLLSESFPTSSALAACLSVFPNFSSNFLSFSAQAASLSSRARLSSSSLRLRALSTASESSGETNFTRGGPWPWAWRWCSSWSSRGSPWWAMTSPGLFCWAWRWQRWGSRGVSEFKGISPWLLFFGPKHWWVFFFAVLGFHHPDDSEHVRRSGKSKLCPKPFQVPKKSKQSPRSKVRIGPWGHGLELFWAVL